MCILGRPAPALPVHDPDVTRLLLRLPDGSPDDREALLAAIYADLRRMASRQLRTEREGHTLATTALVHEAYLRLVDTTQVAWADRAHFFAVASQAMRRVLVDWARARARHKRGGGIHPVSLDALAGGPDVPAEDRADAVLALDEALERLAHLDARKARVVECRYIAGLTIEETAEALGVSPATVKTDWAMARAFLLRDLERDA